MRWDARGRILLDRRLGWPLVWDQNDESPIRAPDLTGPMITWGGAPLTPKLGKNRLHLDIAPLADGDQQAEVDRLLSLGRRESTAAMAMSIGPSWPTRRQRVRR